MRVFALPYSLVGFQFYSISATIGVAWYDIDFYLFIWLFIYNFYRIVHTSIPTLENSMPGLGFEATFLGLGEHLNALGH